MNRPVITSFLGIAILFSVSQCHYSHTLSEFRAPDFKNYSQLRWEKDSSVLVFSSNFSASTRDFFLKKGKYVLTFSTEGTSALKESPHLQIRLNGFPIRTMFIADSLQKSSINFEIMKDSLVSIAFEFDNDYSSSTEDRNLFLHMPVSIRTY